MKHLRLNECNVFFKFVGEEYNADGLVNADSPKL